MEIILRAYEIPADLMEFFEPINPQEKADVFTIATQPFPGSHFATWPPDLVRPMVRAGTSERGCCPACGAPWVREVEKSGSDWEARKAQGEAIRHGLAGAAACQSGGYTGQATTTLGWSPSCACPPHTPIPCTVLDPFAGAGTTALVAHQERRGSVGIELNPDYLALAAARLAPYFTQLTLL